MNWSDLKWLLEFHEAGTLDAVAKKHHVNASTVSRRLRHLEKDLGAKVVENVSGKLVLTQIGMKAVETADTMRVHSDTFMREVMGHDTEIHGTIKIGLLEIFVREYAQLFSQFTQRYPNITLEFLVQGAQLHRLTQRDADIVLRATQQPHDTLVGRRLFTVHYAPFVHPEVYQGPDPKAYRWIAWHDSLRATQTERWIQDNAGANSIVARVTTNASMLDLASAQMGACVLPIRSGQFAGLKQIAPQLKGFDTQIWMLTHRDLMSNARVRTLMQYMSAHFRAPMVSD